jgi:hypothetical protein
MSYHQFFPEVFIQLSREILHPAHEKLIAVLEAEPTPEFSDKIATIAAYVNVALDGHYTQEDLEKVAGICLERLKKRREIIVVSSM